MSIVSSYLPLLKRWSSIDLSTAGGSICRGVDIALGGSLHVWSTSKMQFAALISLYTLTWASFLE